MEDRQKDPVVVEKSPAKKKVRVVKKIVKKKIIKKVLKRVPVASNSNADVDTHLEIEKANVVIDGLKEVEDVQELKVSEMEKCDQVQNELEDSDRSRIELQDVELGNNDQVALLDSVQDGVELQDSDRSRIELGNNDLNRVVSPNTDVNSYMENEKVSVFIDGLKEVENVKELEVSDMEVCDQAHNELQDSDKNGIELGNNDQDRVEMQDSDQNGIELLDREHDTDAMKVEQHESEEGVKELMVNSEIDGDHNQIESLDGEPDINTINVEQHEGEEGVKELMLKSETDGLKSQEALSESNVPSINTIASRLHMKQMRKIFIHGLVQETKEEDIRKVFEEVGEVVEVKIGRNFRSGKSRGFGFITFASADLANLALTKYQNVEICGSACQTAAIEGNDTILLNNIDKKWNNENVVVLLQKIGIKKVGEVLVVPDPDNSELNCGFAFLEFETKKDAQMAYHKLQNENFSGKHSNIKVSWASPFVDPVEEEIHNIKSVYAENIPLSWDEKEVNKHFKMFGEIESIALGKNLRTSKRNDFAFINYKTYEAALSCIEALTCKRSTSNNDPKCHLKVSFAKSIPKAKPVKTVPVSAVTKASKASQKVNQSRQSPYQYPTAYQIRQSQQNLSPLGVYKPAQKHMSGKHDDSRKDLGSSTTAELVQLLREQASWKQGGPSSTAGMVTGHHQLPYVGRQPLVEPGSKSLYHHDPRVYHQSHLQVPSVTHPRSIANVTSFPHYDQQRAHHTPGSFNVVKPDPRYLQIRDQTTYPGSSNIYRQMH
ncbi:hypothetical protein QVD17_14817 [Tagetes erecta]|uniref:RRM domain-containing protein n=1 Tax=Tagetes erecta TaxID=13708 RepID=A0AAD8KNM8_TARER|nr:hypothetical protein QVD17_14817 [Tagetes erecta]